MVSNRFDMRVRKEMRSMNMPAPMQYELLSRIYGPHGSDRRMLYSLAQLDECLSAVRSGLKRCRPNRRPVYEAYIALLVKTRAVITSTLRGTPEAPNPTLVQIRAQAAQTNEARRAQGKRPLGECGAHWSSWIPPHVRETTLLAFEQMYADEVAKGIKPGSRLVPFLTITQRRDMRQRWTKLREECQRHIDAYTRFNKDVGRLKNHSREWMIEDELLRERRRAAGAAMAVISKNIHITGVMEPPPINWVHLLEAPERARLRAAEKKAGGNGYTRTADMGPEIDAYSDTQLPAIRATRSEQFVDRLEAHGQKTFDGLPLIRMDDGDYAAPDQDDLDPEAPHNQYLRAQALARAASGMHKREVREARQQWSDAQDDDTNP